MKLFPSKKTRLSSSGGRYAQQMFDKALADEDYGKKACLKTYSSRTIVITGPDAGQERRAPPAPPKDKVAGGEAGEGVDEHWWNRFSGRSKRRSIPSSVVQNSVNRTPAYITGHISWVEPGLWKGKKAHFVLLDFAHRRGQEYLERVELDVRVWRAGDALQSIAEHSDKPLSSVPPPLAEELADHAPPVVLYAPRTVVGRPADAQVEP